MEEARQALKKLNVFAQMRAKPAGNAMFSKARLDTLRDGIFGVAMTLLILDARLPVDFSPGTAPNWRARLALAGQYRGPHPCGVFQP
jgi:hypothetical protein